MRDNPWPSIPRGLQHARRSLRALVAHAKRSSSGSTPSPSPAPSPSVPSARPRSLSLAPRPPPASPSPSPRTPSTPGPAARPSPRTPSTPGPAARPPPAPAGYARPASTPTRTGGMTLPPQRPARRLPAVHSVRDYPEHLNPFRDDEEAEAAAPPALPGMEDDEPTLRPTQDKFGTWTVPRRRSHLNFEQTWTSREYPSTAATPPSPASRGHNGSAAPPRPPVGPRVAAASGPGTSAAAGTPTPAPRPPVKPRKKRKAPPPPPPKAQQRLSSAVSLPQLSQDLAGAQPGVPVHQSQSQASLASGPDEPSRPDAAVSRSASPEERVSPPPPGAPEPTAPLHDEGPREPHPASGSPAAVHTTEPEAAAEAPRDSHETAEARTSTSTPPAPREQERRSASPTAAEDEARPATPPREQEPRSASPPAAEDEARPATPPREGDQDGRVTPEDGGPSTPTPGHERARAESASPPAPARRQDPLHDPPVIGERPSRSVTPELPGCSPTPSPRSSPSRSSSSPEPPLPPPPALSPGSADTSPAPQRAARAASEECPSPPTPASPCSGSSATSPTAPTPPPPTPPASPGPPERPHCPLAQPEDPDEEEGAEAEGLSQIVPPGASLVTSPRPHLQV